KYIAYGMIAALIIDATFIRMGLVPAVMKLLGDDCWWAPAWMKRIQEKIGLGEPILDNELIPADVPELTPVGAGAPVAAAGAAAAGRRPAPAPAKPAKPEPLTEPIPLVTAQMLAQQITEDQKAAEQALNEARRSATGRPAQAPAVPDEAAVEAGGAVEHPGGPPTEVRPIESWLADLRSMGQDRPRPAAARTDPAPRSSQPQPQRPAATPAERPVAPERSSDRTTPQPAPSGFAGLGATPPQQPTADPRPAPRSPQGVPPPPRRSSTQPASVQPLSPQTPTSHTPTSQPPAPVNGSANPPLPQRPKPAAEPSPHQQYRPYQGPPQGYDPYASGSAQGTPAGPGNNGNGHGARGSDSQNADSQNNDGSDRTRDSDEQLHGSSGRHRPDDSNAVSVSELIARQHRR
ncbi:MAG: hypothetical protein GX542_09800, partial [Rhodococcus sp.]|nr:hypothetical protein [Rhodococcus sp. (in: high G+C Gram-positive bacteria)]